MADQFLRVPPNSTGLMMDLTELTVSGNTVERERVIIAGATDTALADVTAGNALKVDGSAVTQPISIAGSVAVTGPLTDAALRATPVPVSGTVATGGLTDTELRATAVPVSGTVTANLGTIGAAATAAKQDTGNTSLASIDGKITAVNTGAVTITALPNEGQQTMANSISVAVATDQSAVAVSGPLTDAQLRATPVPISGTVTVTDGAGALNVIVDSGTVTAVTAITNALPAGTNVIGHIIADTGSTTAVTGNVATTVADAANVTMGAKADAKSTATDTTAITMMSVLKQISASVQAPPSQAVTNAGTFATQSAITAASGSIASGAIASGAVASGAVASGAFASGSIAAGAVAAGATSFVKLEDVASADADAGVPAMAIQKATPADTAGTDGDYTMLQMSAGRLWTASNATLTAETTKVIGTINIASAQTLGTVTTVSTVSALGNSTTGPQKAEDVASATGDIGIPAMAIQRATPADTAADLDYSMLQMSAGRLWVDPSGVTLTVGSHAVTNAGTFAVQESGTQVQVDDAAFTPATSKIVMAGFEADETSTDSVDEGDGGAARMTLDRKQIVTVQPHTSGGLSTFNGTSSDGGTALTNTSQVISAAAGQVYGWYIYNPNATAQFVQFYNTASASVTVGTTAPLFMLTIPATSAANVLGATGIAFSNAGFSCAATSTAGGNGAPTTALDAVIFYK